MDKVTEVQVTVNLTAEDESKFSQIAKTHGLSLAQFIQYAAQKVAKDLEEGHLIKLSPIESEWFFDLLDNPPPPTTEFKHVMPRDQKKTNPDSNSKS